MFKPCCMVAVLCVTLSGTAVADIINVPGDQPTIQAGIDAAVNGDEVIGGGAGRRSNGECRIKGG